MRLFDTGRWLPFSLLLIISISSTCFSQNPVKANLARTIAGTVRDAAGSAIGQVSISLLNARQAVLQTAQTDRQGEFVFSGVAPGTYELLVSGGRGFAQKRVPVTVTAAGPIPVQIILGPAGLTAEVTVTAEIGTVQALDQTSQQVNVIEEDELNRRAKAVTAQIAQDEPGLQLQRTSPTIGAIFVRGLTGAKVVSYIDGIRFSNAAARGGINSFFNLNDVSNLRAVEVIRGPNSAQYGSDSIGGSVQLISRVPLFTGGGREVHGQFGQHYNSADHSFGGHALTTLGTPRLALLVSAAGHRSNTVRPGGGFESHSAVNRFLGIRSDLLFGERSTDTAFTQYGGLVKLSYRLTDLDQVTFHYQRGQIDGGKRFDQTIGGDGNLVADLRNFMLDFFYGRYERFRA
ncbi:MAG: TonB-dependent receptor plug domain-containing protein, partial [Acidobacteriota bacterium]